MPVGNQNPGSLEGRHHLFEDLEALIDVVRPADGVARASYFEKPVAFRLAEMRLKARLTFSDASPSGEFPAMVSIASFAARSSISAAPARAASARSRQYLAVRGPSSVMATPAKLSPGSGPRKTDPNIQCCNG